MENIQKTQKTYEELTFTDDFMFGKVMSNNLELCKELLELILDIRIRKVELSDEQKRIDLTYDSRGVRLDVYVEDSANTVYDVEMQMKKDNLPKRMRYYQGMIDLNMLCKGASFDELKKSYVIFICVFDLEPNGKNLPVYHFKQLCLENPEIVLDDETTKVIINAKGSRDGLSQEMSAFLDYLLQKPASSDFTKAIEKDVVSAREHREWSVEYMTMLAKINEERKEAFKEGEQQGLQQGLQQGMQQGQAEMMSVMQKLFAAGRIEDARRATTDLAYFNQIKKEFAQ